MTDLTKAQKRYEISRAVVVVLSVAGVVLALTTSLATLLGIRHQQALLLDQSARIAEVQQQNRDLLAAQQGKDARDAAELRRLVLALQAQIEGLCNGSSDPKCAPVVVTPHPSPQAAPTHTPGFVGPTISPTGTHNPRPSPTPTLVLPVPVPSVTPPPLPFSFHPQSGPTLQSAHQEPAHGAACPEQARSRKCA